MKSKTFGLACCFAVAALWVTALPAAAARIYNYLPISIWVGGVDGNVTLKPGEQSRSLSWGLSTIVDVDPAHLHEQLCILFFGVHAELTGGHYLIVGHRDMQVTCTLCDSDGHVMHKDSRRAPEQDRKLFENRSTKIGC